jgi:hypothetical protein
MQTPKLIFQSQEAKKITKLSLSLGSRSYCKILAWNSNAGSAGILDFADAVNIGFGLAVVR